MPKETASFFVPLQILHPFWMMAFLILISVTFSLFGFIIGVWADGFEQLQMIPMLIVTPLTFLGGAFYSIDMLPDGWRTVTLFNPIVYLISGFRVPTAQACARRVQAGRAPVPATGSSDRRTWSSIRWRSGRFRDGSVLEPISGLEHPHHNGKADGEKAQCRRQAPGPAPAQPDPCERKPAQWGRMPATTFHVGPVPVAPNPLDPAGEKPRPRPSACPWVGACDGGALRGGGVGRRSSGCRTAGAR